MNDNTLTAICDILYVDSGWMVHTEKFQFNKLSGLLKALVRYPIGKKGN